ncbi:MAG: dTDP-4-dehydrorhamnose reductase, partial [Kiritimatiellia bacterium]
MAAEAKRTLLVTGAGGQLGTDCVACLSDTWNVIPVRRADGDITNATAIADLFAHHRPDVVVNCA